MRVLVNQLGYEPGEQPRVILRGAAGDEPGAVELRRARTDERRTSTEPEPAGQVPGWRDWVFWTATLPGVDEPGEYVAVAEHAGGTSRSRPFRVAADLDSTELVPDVLSYFRAERCTGAYDRADREATFVGEREDVVDVRGGWYDASGDVSKYLSHLSYANYWNPQQIPLVTWSLASCADHLEASADGGDALAGELAARAREEACHGADFLVRAQDDAGYFYQVVFDGWSGDPDRREICAFEGFDGEKTADYEAGFRQGGGVAVAALARAARQPARGEFGPDTYLETARRGFEHLREHNERYLDDGTENLLDDYCALLGATELYAATDEARFRDAAAERARTLLDRQTDAGWFLADDADRVRHGRPFFHPTDEGLPVVALCRYLDVVAESGDAAETDDPAELADGAPDATAVRAALRTFWDFELGITGEVANPFGYPRQCAPTLDGEEPETRFFLPHDNETGYWWLGESARICSLAAAALATADALAAPALDRELRSFAAAQRDWILGRNPFDVSLYEGVGRNAEPFVPEAVHTPGGIVNGITAGVDDAEGIAFLPDAHADDPEVAWRWSEQWLPHAAWFLQVLARR